jgi:hypothetical protein
LTLILHPHDENFEPQKLFPHLKIKPLQAWYYRIYSNFHTLVILLQVNLVSSNEPKIFYAYFYQIKDTSIFAWSSNFSVGHYHWLCSLTR